MYIYIVASRPRIAVKIGGFSSSDDEDDESVEETSFCVTSSRS